MAPLSVGGIYFAWQGKQDNTCGNFGKTEGTFRKKLYKTRQKKRDVGAEPARDGMPESVCHRLPRLVLVFNQTTDLPDKGLKIVEVRACDQVTETGMSLKALSRSKDSVMSLNSQYGVSRCHGLFYVTLPEGSKVKVLSCGTGHVID
jgi:hypothetical protein